MSTRVEHLAWAKHRALEYVNRGELEQALSSFASDMNKHPDTAGHPAMLLTGHLMFMGRWRTAHAVREHIEGFN